MSFEAIPILESDFRARDVQENFRRLEDLLRGGQPGPTSPEALALIVGGEYFEAVITSGTELRLAHGLGAVPRMVVPLANLSGNGVVDVRGIPAGGLVLPGNPTPWDTSHFYVGSPLTASYAFLVV